MAAQRASGFKGTIFRTTRSMGPKRRFTALGLYGQDLRPLPWRERCTELERIFLRSRAGLVLSRAVVGQGLDGLEGIVSKRTDAPYRSGKVKTWLKIKNPNAPAALRLQEAVAI
jgi:bifunctional non-homologous end joining protein LigD